MIIRCTRPLIRSRFLGQIEIFMIASFFNGYYATDDIFFATALGVYPQLNVMDASICLSIDGTQYNLRTSKEMNMDRRIRLTSRTLPPPSAFSPSCGQSNIETLLAKPPSLPFSY